MPQYHVTQEDIRNGLAQMELRQGDVILVHASLSAFGHVIGGSQAVVGALLDAVGPSGTIVVATHTPENADPREFRRPPVTPRVSALWASHYPAFDAQLTPCPYMGEVAELVRGLRSAVRSHHPLFSFAAVGERAHELLCGHRLEDGLGEGSPLARLYDARGKIVLVGAGHDANTSLHLAEARAGAAERKPQRAAWIVDGRRQWLSYSDLDWDNERFAEIGADFEATQAYRQAHVGAALLRCFDQRALVDFAVEWYRSGPRAPVADSHPPQQLELGGLRLRAPTLDDARALAPYAVRPCHDGASKGAAGRSLEDTQSQICDAIHDWELQRGFTWLLERTNSHALVGVVRAVPQSSRLSLAWDIPNAEPALARALRAFFAALLEQMPDVWRIEYLCNPSDEPNVQLAPAAGLTLEGRLRCYAVGANGLAEDRLIFGHGRPAGGEPPLT